MLRLGPARGSRREVVRLTLYVRLTLGPTGWFHDPRPAVPPPRGCSPPPPARRFPPGPPGWFPPPPPPRPPPAPPPRRPPRPAPRRPPAAIVPARGGAAPLHRRRRTCSALDVATRTPRAVA